MLYLLDVHTKCTLLFSFWVNTSKVILRKVRHHQNTIILENVTGHHQGLLNAYHTILSLPCRRRQRLFIRDKRFSEWWNTGKIKGSLYRLYVGKRGKNALIPWPINQSVVDILTGGVEVQFWWMLSRRFSFITGWLQRVFLCPLN